MDDRDEASTASGSSTLRRRFQSLMTRSSSFNRNKGTVDLRKRSKSQEECDISPGTAPTKPPRVDLRKVPEMHELAFYVAMESSQEVREIWEDLLTVYHTELNLIDVIESFKSRRNLRADSHSFLSIYAFYNNDVMRFHEVLQAECKAKRCSSYDNIFSQITSFHSPGLFSTYVKSEAMTSLELNGVFNGRLLALPKCIFTIANLEKLSLSNNNLRMLPADIGRLDKLRYLKLSHNRLKNDSIPYTLSFCKQLSTLHLDFNSLDAIPGFILQLKKLKTLHRHGNQNYFRTTFMWYGCEKRERIRTASFSDIDMAASTLRCATEVQSLKFWAAKSIISRKVNYFKLDEKISEAAIDDITNAYKMFNVCEGCMTAKLLHEQGYFVFTFMNPYLGNTCVPFQHWACSKECALRIEIPARRQQIEMAKQQNDMYERHVKLCSSNHTINEHSSYSHDTSSSLLSQRIRTRFGRSSTANNNHRRQRCKIM